MEILQVAPRYPPHTGGVETHVAEISRRFADWGHDVTVYTADAGDDVPSRQTIDGVSVRRFRGVAPGGAFHVAPTILPAVRRADPDVVHAHNYHSLPLLFAALGAGDARLVVTPHYHGTSASGVRDRLLSAYRPLGGHALDRADRVVAVSDWERDRLRGDFGVEPTVIPNGVDVERFADAEPSDRDRPYLLCVGRLEEYKGVQHAIRALNELPDYELLVAGSGEYGDELRRVADSAGVADRVTFLGYVDDDRLPGLYAGADALLALSSFEAYGMTVAEALAAGTPCVVRPAGALVDWIDREDCVAASGIAPPAVADAVERATGHDAPSDPLPTWDEVADRLLAVFETAGRPHE
ncbi:Glycosyltransferase involved in cell wall bisynthesis [Natronoarchaeum philippinense]|uniref:Glycosyltransferase involved in cell wall bisynthesis n=1 Tax=Natronoarchaeum philippinense TaxID=558529 RepID=A0A285NBC1_NATPI|nr:glycosyltransferase family 4 protein [Natronoarchaeum philippinense]SNZ06784.1 Glycosyltransferase involved in cell wall bisynthesis [Natronoarchaeum philippinense]